MSNPADHYANPVPASYQQAIEEGYEWNGDTGTTSVDGSHEDGISVFLHPDGHWFGIAFKGTRTFGELISTQEEYWDRA